MAAFAKSWQREVKAGARARLYPGADFRVSCRPPQSGVSMHTAPLVALFVGDLLVGEILLACSPAAMGPVTVFVDPGKYQYYNCEQLAGQRTYWTNRELELKMLMDKTEQGTGGTVVNVIAYQTDYVTAREELKVIDATVRAKNCDGPRRP
jgi:hypothetical protein